MIADMDNDRNNKDHNKDNDEHKNEDKAMDRDADTTIDNVHDHATAPEPDDAPETRLGGTLPTGTVSSLAVSLMLKTDRLCRSRRSCSSPNFQPPQPQH